MQLRVSRFALAAALLAGSLSTAAACATDLVESPGLHATEGSEPGRTSALPQNVSITPTSDSEFDIAFAFDNWMLLLDHEGESFAAFPISQIEPFEHPNEKLAAHEKTAFAPLAPEQRPVRPFLLEDGDIEAVPVRPFLVDDDDVAVFSQVHDADVTGSIPITSARHRLAMDGYEDR